VLIIPVTSMLDSNWNRAFELRVELMKDFKSLGKQGQLVRCQVDMAANTKMKAFWDTAPYSLIHRRFRGAYCTVVLL
jgi:hypothetical protein